MSNTKEINKLNKLVGSYNDILSAYHEITYYFDEADSHKFSEIKASIKDVNNNKKIIAVDITKANKNLIDKVDKQIKEYIKLNISIYKNICSIQDSLEKKLLNVEGKLNTLENNETIEEIENDE